MLDLGSRGVCEEQAFPLSLRHAGREWRSGGLGLFDDVFGCYLLVFLVVWFLECFPEDDVDVRATYLCRSCDRCQL